MFLVSMGSFDVRKYLTGIIVDEYAHYWLEDDNWINLPYKHNYDFHTTANNIINIDNADEM